MKLNEFQINSCDADHRLRYDSIQIFIEWKSIDSNSLQWPMNVMPVFNQNAAYNNQPADGVGW